MNVEEAIRTRRSIGKVKEDPVPRELVERVIEAAVWAPNHHHTEPWKFVVLAEEGRGRLGRAYAEIAAETMAGPGHTDEEREQRRLREEAKARRAPVVIAAVRVPSASPKAIAEEDRAAVHAAVQNLLLAAHAIGLGAVWRTGDQLNHPAVKRELGLSDAEEVVGFVYIGYPDMTAPAGRRTPGTEKTVWLET